MCFCAIPFAMGYARAAKVEKERTKENQVRARGGSKGRDSTRLKHVAIQMQAEAKARISSEIVAQDEGER